MNRDLFDVIVRRRSIRRFRPDPVADEDLQRILEAGRLAPSGSNCQPWTFLVIRDEARRARLREAAADQPFVESAPALIVSLGNRKAMRKRLRRGRELVEMGAVDGELLARAQKLYTTRTAGPESETRSIVANCCIAVEHMALAAEALGYGSCWVMLMDSERVAEVLDLPDHLFPVALLPLGRPDQAPGPRPRYALGEIAFDETLQRPWPER